MASSQCGGVVCLVVSWWCHPPLPLSLRFRLVLSQPLCCGSLVSNKCISDIICVAVSRSVTCPGSLYYYSHYSYFSSCVAGVLDFYYSSYDVNNNSNNSATMHAMNALFENNLGFLMMPL